MAPMALEPANMRLAHQTAAKLVDTDPTRDRGTLAADLRWLDFLVAHSEKCRVHIRLD
jgi:hypothetical protein